MKKILFALLVLSLVLFSFASCSGKSGGPVELTVWESTAGPDEFIKQAGAAFTANNPDITIKYVNVELGDAAKQISLDGPAGVGADIFAAPHDAIGQLVSDGHILPTADGDKIKGQVLAACAQAITYDGKAYGYPVSAETYALYYNKAFVTDPPKTWDDVIAFCESYNSANKYGFMMDVGNAYYTILFTSGGGNRLFGPNGDDQTKTYLNTDAAVKGMETLVSLRKILDVAAGDLNTSFADGAFQSGTAAMHISGPWNIKNFEDAGVDFGVAPLPSLPGESTPAGSFSGTRCMFVSAYTKHPEEAAKFAEFLISPEMQKLRFDLTGAIPSIDITVDSPYIGGFLEQLKYAFPMPSVPKMSGFWDAMNNASANIWNGADIKGELDACDTKILNS
ncbi:MAG: maltose ABC transporter substrate-binding protein [Oscillospiraceae bacterium]|nr:maltose ABC transporter substrate-binding protein [Oscillospiraceae bacterium]